MCASWSLATCSFPWCVWTYTGRKSHLIWVFPCGTRNLIWASGGNSSRNATCFGCVCVDRFGSWCFCALSAGFWANFRAIVENTMERREKFKDCGKAFRKRGQSRGGHWRKSLKTYQLIINAILELAIFDTAGAINRIHGPLNQIRLRKSLTVACLEG